MSDVPISDGDALYRRFMERVAGECDIQRGDFYWMTGTGLVRVRDGTMEVISEKLLES